MAAQVKLKICFFLLFIMPSESTDGRVVQGGTFRSYSPLEAWVRTPLSAIFLVYDFCCTLEKREKGSKKTCQKELEERGIDPRASRMLSERSTM